MRAPIDDVVRDELGAAIPSSVEFRVIFLDGITTTPSPAGQCQCFMAEPADDFELYVGAADDRPHATPPHRRAAAARPTLRRHYMQYRLAANDDGMI